MSDLSETYNKAVAGMTQDGVLPPDALSSGADGTAIANSIAHVLRLRLLRNLLGMDAASSLNYSDQTLVRNIQKINDVAGLSDVTGPLDAAAAETAEAVRARPSWQEIARVPPEGENKKPGSVLGACDKAFHMFFAEGIMWDQCCGNDKAPMMHHYLFVGLVLRVLNQIPGFDTGNEVAEYDRKLLGQIREFNDMAGLKDIRRILDAAAGQTLEDLGLKMPEKMQVMKPLQVKLKEQKP